MNVKEIVVKTERFLAKNLPNIATGIGVGGFVTTVALSIKIAPKAKAIYDEELKKKPDMNLYEKAKVLAPYYWPVAASGAVSISFIIAANLLNGKRNAAAIAAYQLSDAALKEFKEASKKTIGEKKTADIEEAVAKEKIKENPGNPKSVIITGGGDYLCYDSISGRYFRSTQEKVRRAVNLINQRLISEYTIGLNEFYDELGLEHVVLGDMLGWNMRTMNDVLDVTFSTCEHESGEPALVLVYNVAPTYDYFDFT